MRGSIITQILRKNCDIYKEDYQALNNGKAPGIEAEAILLDNIKSRAGEQADIIIENLVDMFMEKNYKWLPIRNLGVASVFIIPAIGALTFYGLMHLSYLWGQKNAFAELGYLGLSGTVVSILLLVGALITVAIDELKEE